MHFHTCFLIGLYVCKWCIKSTQNIYGNFESDFYVFPNIVKAGMWSVYQTSPE